MSSNCTSEIDDHVTSSTTKNEEEEVDANFSQLVLQEIGFIKESFEAVKHKADHVIDEANEARKKFEELMLLPEGRAEERNFKLRELKKKVSKMRMKIPFKLIAPEEQPHPNVNINYWPRPELDKYQDKDDPRKTNNINDHDQGNYCYDDNDDIPALSYDELESTMQGLEYYEKYYLACFFFFPKNAFIKESVLRCWCKILFLPTDQMLEVLVEKRLIRVYKKLDMTVAGYRMYPSVHSNLRSNINWFGGYLPRYVGNSHDVYNKYIYHEARDFEQSIHIKSINYWVLYLGKWNNSTDQHIEVINPDFFFKDMSSKLYDLRFVSLRGISMIEELPKFITELKLLQILDLNACHNLEVIPSSIAKLKYLDRLDISKCYFLNHLPKSLAKLRNLRVLKGFVVGENKEVKSCSLADLASLQLLVKLNIYTSIKGFPNKSQLATLQRLPRLLSLTISWRGCAATNGQENPNDRMNPEMAAVEDCETLSLPIKKLDLQCVPETVTRRWLKPTSFRYLKKLYIRGGKFFDLSEEGQWKVETLRLKHLSNLKIHWGELRPLFPRLKYLEKVNCPNLNHFPCDNSGIWMKNQQS